MAWGFAVVTVVLSALSPITSAQEPGQESLRPIPKVLPPTIFDDDEVWVSVGPRGIPLANHDVISGQLNAVTVHPFDANTLYVGASEGGVWKTSNGGASWTPLTDFQLVRALPNGVRRGTTSIGSIAIDPTRPNFVYAGSGDPNVACCFVGPGLGVFRSVDAGQTWTPTGTTFNRPACQNAAMSQAVVNRMLVRPGIPTVLVAASNMGLFTYREDGTDCWVRPLKGLPASGNAIDLVVDTFEGSLYVAYSGQGIFRSDGASTTVWTKLAQGLPASGFGRIALAFAGRRGLGFSTPSRRLYAGLAVGSAYQLFHTTNGGDLWTSLPSPPNDGQLGFNNVIAVGSYDGDEVYVGQIAVRRAIDGGRTGGLNDFGANPPVVDRSWTNLSCCLPHANPFRKGLDLHGDVHDIVFAPYGSFIPSPSEVQIVFVATDGGVTKGSIDFEGVVTWTPLTAGLAIGQCGSLGLHPDNTFESVCGLWHNGNAMLNSVTGVAVPVGGGDGFNATIDAAPSTTVYENCNAGFGGDICRDVRKPVSFAHQKIWTAQGGGKHFSDPYRPGHLFNLQGGLLFRTEAGTTASESDLLNGPNAWELVEPPGKSGNTTTMAFRSWVLEESPVYYLGTSTGQIWRGSPEVGWLKLCECGPQVNGLSPDLFRNERLYAVFNSQVSPGRIKLLTRQGNGSWVADNIDVTFKPTLQVLSLTSVAAKPVLPFFRDTTVYVGTDQGVHRGRLDASGWTWTQAIGMPNVFVTDLKVHQSSRFFDLTRIVRASTYGRGIYELRQSQGPVIAGANAVTIQALRVGGDGAPPSLTVNIEANSARERGMRQTPFDVARFPEMDVTLEAPAEVRDHDATLSFAGWVIDGSRTERRNRITVKLEEVSSVVAHYVVRQRVAQPRAGGLKLSFSSSAREVCVAGFTHELTLTWEAIGGQPPLEVGATIYYPDKSSETIELKHFSGLRQIPVNFPGGGTVSIRATATDSAKGTATAQSTVPVKPCR
jgi:photosystem II stability/assembly factor-like uncharacterized protein